MAFNGAVSCFNFSFSRFCSHIGQHISDTSSFFCASTTARGPIVNHRYLSTLIQCTQFSHLRVPRVYTSWFFCCAHVLLVSIRFFLCSCAVWGFLKSSFLFPWYLNAILIFFFFISTQVNVFTRKKNNKKTVAGFIDFCKSINDFSSATCCCCFFCFSPFHAVFSRCFLNSIVDSSELPPDCFCVEKHTWWFDNKERVEMGTKWQKQTICLY